MRISLMSSAEIAFEKKIPMQIELDSTNFHIKIYQGWLMWGLCIRYAKKFAMYMKEYASDQSRI